MAKDAITLKKELMYLIEEMARSPALFVQNPAKDFTRERKLALDRMLSMMISMGGNSIGKELLDFYEYDAETATTSAFIQQRKKILPFAFEFLFHEFTSAAAEPKTYRGYRLLAIDGSDLHIPTNPSEPENYFVANEDTHGYNLLHLNAIYDLCSKLFTDILLQTRRSANEHLALTTMVDRSRISSEVILVADRGYESYNNLAHIGRKGWNYVFRLRESNSILSGLRLPVTQELDLPVSIILTKKQTKEVKAHPEIYRWLPHKTRFDFLDLNFDRFYPITFRVVRFKLSDDSFETLITNLDAIAFPADALKEIYHLRWGIETSFRELKYAVGLLNFHSKKTELITQEIFAQLIMYNFSMMIASHAIIRQNHTRYAYQVNFTRAIQICVFFFRYRSNAPPDADALICKHILPIRPGRTDKRKLRSRSAVSFLYRVA